VSLFQVLEILISHGHTEGLQAKVNVFYAVGQLTEEEYTALTGRLGGEGGGSGQSGEA
jgi:hypothetical protein